MWISMIHLESNKMIEYFKTIILFFKLWFSKHIEKYLENEAPSILEEEREKEV